MNHFEVHISNVLGIVIVLDLTVGPVLALNPEHLAWVD